MITFLATAYKETIDAYQFISCLILQKNPKWRCIIHCDEKNSYIEESIKFFNDERISVVSNETPTGVWGHFNRQKTLNDVNTEYIIQTSIQDYYTPNSVEVLLNELGNCDMVIFNCIHNHFNYNVLDSQPVRDRVDWGSFVIKTDIAKKVGINHPLKTNCDGLFVEECVKYPNIRIKKINKILTVHN